ncbi:MAG: LysR family transcriptional regulator [Acidobacteria bacterium]|nr:LysR family transcriptional regulator [Acidobacteriota bacterium]
MDISNLPDLSVRELLAIVAVSDSGSFVAATRLLKVGLPTLSRTVKRVERVVGVRLFERTTRRVDITPAGRAFVAIAQRLLSDLQLSLQDLGEVAAEQRGQVAISTFGVFAHEMLPPIFHDYLSTRPEVQLQVHVGPFTDVLERVVSGQCDFGITYVDTLPDTVHRITLRKEPMYVVLPHDHPLGRNKKASISLAELQGTPLVSLPPDTYTRRVLDGAAASAGVWLKHSVIVPGFLDVLSHASAGVGVGIVPSGVISDRFLARLKARPLRPALSMSIGLIALKSRHVTPAASALMRLVLDTIRQHETALRTEFLTSSLAAFEDLPHGPYELLWRPAIPSAAPAKQSAVQRPRKTARPARGPNVRAAAR